MNEYISRENVLKKAKSSISVPADNEWDCGYNTAMAEMQEFIKQLPSADVQPIDDDNGHIIYIGRKAYLAENTIMEFMKKMDIIRDSLAYIENYFDTYAETIRQINACSGRCTDITEVKYFIDRIKENSGYD